MSVIFGDLKKEFPIEDYTGYNFYIFNNLWCKSDHEKSEHYVIIKITGCMVWTDQH